MSSRIWRLKFETACLIPFLEAIAIRLCLDSSQCAYAVSDIEFAVEEAKATMSGVGKG